MANHRSGLLWDDRDVGYDPLLSLTRRTPQQQGLRRLLREAHGDDTEEPGEGCLCARLWRVTGRDTGVIDKLS